MGNVRVFNLARDLNLPSQEVIERLRKLGVEVKTASSSIDEDTADKLKRALKIDALTARKKRVYGSEEEEAERETQERQIAERITAEREAREKAAAEAKKAAEARKVAKAHGGKGEKEAEKSAAKTVADEPPPALQHAPGAPRLAPKVVAPPPVAVLDEQEEPVDEPAFEEDAQEAAAAESEVAVEDAPAEAPETQAARCGARGPRGPRGAAPRHGPGASHRSARPTGSGFTGRRRAGRRRRGPARAARGRGPGRPQLAPALGLAPHSASRPPDRPAAAGGAAPDEPPRHGGRRGVAALAARGGARPGPVPRPCARWGRASRPGPAARRREGRWGVPRPAATTEAGPRSPRRRRTRGRSIPVRPGASPCPRA